MNQIRANSFAVCLAAISLTAHSGSSIPVLEDGPLGLHPSSGLKITVGNCPDCAAPKQALWYFNDDIIAAPTRDVPVAGLSKDASPLDDVATFIKQADAQALQAQPPLIWIGSKEVIPSAHLTADGKSITLQDGSHLAFEVVPKIATNLSYYNEASLAYLSPRPLRLRGETTIDAKGTPKFIARTIWPLDFSISPESKTQPLEAGENLKTLVKANNGGATSPYASRLIWERSPGIPRDWNNKAVLGFMLNGAQGDDDEAHGGHFAITTGRFRADGDWSRWMVYNFYNLGSVSEKGIIAAPTPMDKYMLDLNNGQSWYRPSYMLVAVLKQDRAAIKYQAAIERLYNHFYRHDIEYNHSRANCAGISEDTLETLGWKPPHRGHEPLPKAVGAYVYVSATSKSLSDGRKIYDYLLEEATRLYPATTFDALGEDLLKLVQGKVDRPLTDYEKALKDDVEAIYYVHIPQIPSSRAFGLAPVYSFDEYMKQAPADRSQWKVIPTGARPFPNEMRDGYALRQEEPVVLPLPVAIALVGIIGIIYALGHIIVGRRNRRRKS